MLLDSGCADGRHIKQAKVGGAICRDLAKLSANRCLKNAALDSKSCFRERRKSKTCLAAQLLGLLILLMLVRGEGRM